MSVKWRIATDDGTYNRRILCGIRLVGRSFKRGKSERLMRAAPELLESLRELEDAVNFTQENWHHQTDAHRQLFSKRLVKARALISEIDGESTKQ